MKSLRWILAGILCCALFLASVGVAYAQEETPVPETTTPEPETTSPEVTSQNPVAIFLAQVTGSTVEEIIALQQEGYGMGTISKAYFYLQQLQENEEGTTEGALTLEDVLAQAHLVGWGNLWKEAGFGPGVGHGIGWLFKHDTDDEDETATETTETQPDTQGQSHHGNPDWAGGNHNNGNNGNNVHGHH
jgi:hypothetical protein